jgi:hypothetical protein
VDHTGLTWRKSSRSGTGTNGSCVEVARLPHATAVRDSKNPSAGILTFTSDPWRAFLTGVSTVPDSNGA